jgi:hypothetical protein
VPSDQSSERYTDCNFFRAAAFTDIRTLLAAQGVDVFSCDYNGWADVPEEEREAIDAFEVAQTPSAPLLFPVVIRPPLPPPLPLRKAA